jgi:hypothetical protein
MSSMSLFLNRLTSIAAAPLIPLRAQTTVQLRVVLAGAEAEDIKGIDSEDDSAVISVPGGSYGRKR